MTFRTRLLLIFTVAVVVSVGLVEWLVSAGIRYRFERLESQRVDALVACDESRLVNRYVRPLLRALTKVGATAHFFGRDWVSVAGRPVAWVGFAHDAGTRRTVFEAVVAVGAPYVVRARESTGGTRPARGRAYVRV